MAVSASLMNNGVDAAPQSPQKPVQLSIHTSREWPDISRSWAELEQSSPYSSFYLSTDWTTAWIEIFGELLQPQILVFKDDNVVVGACLLVASTERRGPFRVKRIFLNTSGGDIADRTLMEFNSLLCRAGYEDAVSHALSEHLQKLEWDEFVVEGIFPGTVLSSLQKALPEYPPDISLWPSFHVDLEQLRKTNVTYERTLSANTREQLRRSLKLYAALGDLKVEVAPDLGTAERFFDDMCRMHQSTWAARGESGAFAPGRRLEFHRALIRRAFAKGFIQMLRVAAGDETIGILYNFVQGGKVYFFQSGFHYKSEKHLKPGLVTHACAIRYCMQAGFADYDFLAGDARYKRSLAKDCRQMAWVVFPRKSIKLSLIEALRTIKRSLKKSASRRAH